MSPVERKIPQPAPRRLDVDGIIDGFARRMRYSMAKDKYTASDFDVYLALAFAVRDLLVERWFATQDAYYRTDTKRVYYLSLEFLMGRTLLHNILNLGAHPAFREATGRMGYELDDLLEREWDAGLGNGGLGRLAACFLDAAATLRLPFYGYGIRYEYGIFTQRIRDGHQVEGPDNWLRYGNPWEIARPSVLFPVSFYGRTERYHGDGGVERSQWIDAHQVWAMAYDVPVIGFRNDAVNSLRLWAAKSSREFNLEQFNAGEYVRAVEDKNETENISKVLYPTDDLYVGKELRLRQQYFFVSATLQDVIRRFLKRGGRRWEELPDKVAVQLNDTHPALAIPELMRVLVDRERLEWDMAWALTERVFGYTNHTVLPEALETWPRDLMARLLPRHMEIIEEIDRRLRGAVSLRFPGDPGRAERMAILTPDRVRMAPLAVVGSHSVNGVAKLHTEILRSSVLADFDQMFPERFNNKTNGITPRRWLLLCNPGLASLISEAIGESWTSDLDRLSDLKGLADDSAFQERWAKVKHANKVHLAQCARSQGFDLDPERIFDCQVKRIHEYKRQLLNVFHVIALAHRIREGAAVGAPRTVIMAGKAAPSYVMAKLIIKLVHSVADWVRADPVVGERLRLVFLPNYSVSMAEKIFPACELSEQISTAGTEASGTGNMKAALNGALTIGTWDGANVEIAEAVGAERLFLFGYRAEGIVELRRAGYRPAEIIDANPELSRVLDTIARLEPERAELFEPILRSIREDDRYFLCADFASYLDCQQRAALTYLRRDEWTRMSILNVAGMGRFSIDRTTREYAREIWGVSPVDGDTGG